ncbi:gamma-glutamylcyclotransferase family protein [Knoellia sinensis]|nr:gamma-glutamylcyclotransferase family protein [Knoellia sinensis]
MTDRLFVYGTLAPGRPNEHVLADVLGTWEAATVRGTLLPHGWGAEVGFPGIVLAEEGVEDGAEDGLEVGGVLFSSEELARHWERLDEFEGEGYERVLTRVTRDNGETVDAHIYVPRGVAFEPQASTGA